MKMIMCASVVLLSLTATSVAGPAPKASSKVNALTRMGGRIVKPGSQKGRIALIDAQTRVDNTNFVEVASHLSVATKLNVVCEKATKDDPTALKAKFKADFAVVIVDDPNAPAMLVAPEDGWSQVNVAKLDRNLNSDAAIRKFYVGRCRKEVIRAFSLMCGGGASQFPGNLMNASKIEDLDTIREDGVPVDMIAAYNAYLAPHGVTPKEETVYIKACREGWAPQPTNDAQRAIWNRVHSLPTNPLPLVKPTK